MREVIAKYEKKLGTPSILIQGVSVAGRFGSSAAALTRSKAILLLPSAYADVQLSMKYGNKRFT